VGNPIVAVMRVPADIAIELVTHVQELFGDDDLDSGRARGIDPVEMDEHGMATARSDKAVRTANRPANGTSPDPSRKGWTVGGNVEIVGREGKERNVFGKQITYAVITHFENHG
jgi:hypothetical protein